MVSLRLSNIIFAALLCFAVVSCNTRSKTELPPATMVLNEQETESQKSSEMNYIEAIVFHTCVQEQNQDPSIQLVRSNDQKTPFSTIIFHDIPGKPPYRLEARRILQDDPNLFYEATDAQKTLNAIGELKLPFGVLLLQNAYLPGERVTWRISSDDGKVLKEATCCPNPKVVKNSSGKRIIEASLLSINRPDTVYMLLFPPMKGQREYIFTCGTKQSRGIISSEKLETTTFAPGTDGSAGGIAKIEIRLDNESYELELPWGTEFKINPSIEGLDTSYLLNDGIIKKL